MYPKRDMFEELFTRMLHQFSVDWPKLVKFIWIKLIVDNYQLFFGVLCISFFCFCFNKCFLLLCTAVHKKEVPGEEGLLVKNMFKNWKW